MQKWLLQWLLIFAAILPSPAADCCKDSVAIIASVSHQVTMRLPGAPAGTAVSGLEWVPAGATLEVGPDSSATVILLSGRRYELHAGTNAVVGAERLIHVTGRVRELTPLPPLPKFVPIADAGESSPGAVRFRGPNAPQYLYPGSGAAALPSSVTLQFSAVPEASAYEVTLEEDTGETLFRERTTSTSLVVPPGKLRAGRRYSWRVRAIGSGGVLGQGSAEFVTVSREDIEQRTKFSEALKETAEASHLALLADLDLRMGLVAEARAEFEAALRLKPDDAVLQRALERLRMLPTDKAESKAP